MITAVLTALSIGSVVLTPVLWAAPATSAGARDVFIALGSLDRYPIDQLNLGNIQRTLEELLADPIRSGSMEREEQDELRQSLQQIESARKFMDAVKQCDDPTLTTLAGRLRLESHHRFETCRSDSLQSGQFTSVLAALSSVTPLLQVGEQDSWAIVQGLPEAIDQIKAARTRIAQGTRIDRWAFQKILDSGPVSPEECRAAATRSGTEPGLRDIEDRCRIVPRLLDASGPLPGDGPPDPRESTRSAGLDRVALLSRRLRAGLDHENAKILLMRNEMLKDVQNDLLSRNTEPGTPHSRQKATLYRDLLQATQNDQGVVYRLSKQGQATIESFRRLVTAEQEFGLGATTALRNTLLGDSQTEVHVISDQSTRPVGGVVLPRTLRYPADDDVRRAIREGLALLSQREREANEVISKLDGLLDRARRLREVSQFRANMDRPGAGHGGLSVAAHNLAIRIAREANHELRELLKFYPNETIRTFSKDPNSIAHLCVAARANTYNKSLQSMAQPALAVVGGTALIASTAGLSTPGVLGAGLTLATWGSAGGAETIEQHRFRMAALGRVGDHQFDGQNPAGLSAFESRDRAHSAMVDTALAVAAIRSKSLERIDVIRSLGDNFLAAAERPAQTSLANVCADFKSRYGREQPATFLCELGFFQEHAIPQIYFSPITRRGDPAARYFRAVQTLRQGRGAESPVQPAYPASNLRQLRRPPGP